MTNNEGGLDFNALLQQAQTMQQKMMEAQSKQANSMLQGSAAGGKVVIEANGLGEFHTVTIAPDAVDPDDVEMLEDLVLAALRDLSTQIANAGADAFGGIGIPDLGGAGGGGLGDLGKLLGGS